MRAKKEMGWKKFILTQWCAEGSLECKLGTTKTEIFAADLYLPDSREFLSESSSSLIKASRSPLVSHGPWECGGLR